MSLLLGACGAAPPTSTAPSERIVSEASAGRPVVPLTVAAASPKPTPNAAAKRSRPAVDCKKLKCIALTYDDGPNPRTTGKLIKILKKHKVRATFFQLGQLARRHPKLVRKIHRAGSEVANHSWDHDSLNRKSVKGAYRDLKRASAAIEKGCRCRVRLMRPPYGATDRGVTKAARKAGLAEILWDVDTLDWSSRNARKIKRKVLRGAARNRIVLMHDIHRSTIAAQEGIIRGLKKRGYTLVTVSELLGKPKPGKRYPKSWR
ncbi:polysaccharide deacetylase family protein [Microlunatus parietis]|uniref:Peptidoglycan/xylan/chitin deacetylase (PgdA/CDA1 family) n=1 Tax=Microlunatus parietis TaxID=682979 RepID=A0A7Y9I6I8_9ACTN|nr:polysaccharide deacetylase family protein [Microlunatus parietis]NYE70911.1 peptidoglycan/xylan/chitin deacetylase (PgdA/CDA1 family) [Microlunatus parietis]